ncbi:desulfatase [Mucilaginibacter hurinus]|uniref:Desulfatase n=1 Tax=Mucilaginibacter hurinus TaxID=2201324 RepID=A0A367GSQ5_9SPHI|nr:aminoglycoside phosphotransferase family protein [Mucilaginibacter hurinus]RCH56462.1 desulfatase [Mucilaginibacter hurinus]
MQSIDNIIQVTRSFHCTANTATLKVFGSGHINNTFWLQNELPGGSPYLLQCINHQIFTDVEKLTENMCRVISHLKQKVSAAGGDPDKEVMTLIPGKDGKYFYKDEYGSYWRMAYFLENTKTYDIVSTQKQARQAGIAFGRFQQMLSDMPAGVLHEVIPDFHNARKRLQALDMAIANDPLHRLKEVSPEIDYVKRYASAMLYFEQPEQQSKLPKRVTHNDTKCNNVLLNMQDEAQCVIDLDTVMDGYLAFDFGDAIRTIINKAAEDEANIENVQLNMPLFEAYTAAYLKEVAGFITPEETASLIKGVMVLPYTQTVRFLTDYLNGDTYYKVKFAGHNLQRARAQLQLFKQLYANRYALRKYIENEMRNYR